MEASYYWLISITTEALTVGLIKRDNPDTLLALGPETEWLPDNPDSFLHSVDISLSAAAEKALLEPDQEPEFSAFILPPSWIGNDGKIFPKYLKLLESLCHSLELKPLGFISNDEAFIESVNKNDSFPPSFILVCLGKKEFSLSLVYLGEVKKRLSQTLVNDFSPEDLENALLTIQMDLALPPKILIYGNLGPSIIDDLKNYSWVGKKNIETFLHLPDVNAFEPEELFNLYSQTVSSQIGSTSVESKLENAPIQPVEEEEKIVETTVPEIIEDETFPPPVEVAPEDLGFSEATKPEAKLKLSLPVFSLPKFKLPHFNFNFWLLFPLALSPLLILIPYFLIKAEITINFNPIEINKVFDISLDSLATSASITILPVDKKTLDINFTQSLPTTGQKETGDKAKGEIIIFNKDDKIQNISKGTVMTDNADKKYELLTSIQVPASSFNLASGTITMGQTKASAIASDIGSEFNLNKDTLLSFKDDSNLLAKVNEAFTGGSRRQIQVVSSDDKNELTKKVEASLEDQISQKISGDSSYQDLLKDTLFIDKKQLVFSREVGEEAQTLEVNANLTISLMQINSKQKDNIIKTLLASDQNFLESVASPSDFSFSFAAEKTTSQRSTGKLTLIGKTLPKIDADKLRSLLAGKDFTKAQRIIESQPHVYDRNIKIIPSIFSFLKRLPPSADKITIISKF